MKKAILFDLDGTLTDSGEGIINCAQYAFQQMGYPVPPREEMGVFVGPPLWDTFEKFGIPKERTDEAVQIFRSRYVPIGKFENTPYPGIRELLEALGAEGNLLYVATSKPETTAVEVLEHFDLAGYFDRICGADLEKKRNSKDAVIAYLLNMTGSDAEMVMVGDTEYDVLGAAAHGIPTIGVRWGYGDHFGIAGPLRIGSGPFLYYSPLRMARFRAILMGPSSMLLIHARLLPQP